MQRGPLRDALNISIAAVAWGVVSGVASVVVGVGAGSTALVGTGADIVADVLSSVVLVWRFRGELHGHHTSNAAEERAERIASICLVIVALGIGIAAALRLASSEGAEASAAGIAIAAASVAVLPFFAVAKVRIARAVPSPALRMDGTITLVGAAMAAITLIGLALTSTLGWSAADPIAAIVIALAALSVGATNLRH